MKIKFVNETLELYVWLILSLLSLYHYPEHLVPLERLFISLSNASSFVRIIQLLDEHHIWETDVPNFSPNKKTKKKQQTNKKKQFRQCSPVGTTSVLRGLGDEMIQLSW